MERSQNSGTADPRPWRLRHIMTILLVLPGFLAACGRPMGSNKQKKTQIRKKKKKKKSSMAFAPAARLDEEAEAAVDL